MNTIGDYCATCTRHCEYDRGLLFIPRALCIVADYISLMRRLTGLEAREERRGGVLSADVSRETLSGMYSTNVLSLCRRGGVSTIGVASSAGASAPGYAKTFDAVAAVCAGLSGIACRCFLFLLSTAPWSVSTRYDLAKVISRGDRPKGATTVQHPKVTLGCCTVVAPFLLFYTSFLHPF